LYKKLESVMSFKSYREKELEIPRARIVERIEQHNNAMEKHPY
jgi:hypothetical protein